MTRIDITPDRANRRTFIHLHDLPSWPYRGIRQAFFAIGHELTDRIRQRIVKGPKTGRFYRIKGRKRRHRASAPGQPPANLSGALQRTSGFEIQGADSMELGYRQDYGRVLELGLGRIDERPNIAHVVTTTAGIVHGYFRTELKKEFKR